MRMNMKAIRYTLGMLLACLALISCQEIEEPLNTVPTVVTGEPLYVSTNFVTFTGSVSSRAECYFLISTSEDMSDARQVDVYPYFDGDVTQLWQCPMELGDLQPGTTYYVVLCATDGRSEVRGNVVSFTTLDALHIGSVTYTPWGEETPVDFVDETALGGFLLYGNLQGDIWQNNLMIPYDFDNAEWSLPERDSFEGDAAMIAYWPYRQSANPWELAVSNGEDFSISFEGENTVGGTIHTVVIGNHDDPETYSRYEAIPWEGLLNMTTNTLTPYYNSHDGVWIECNIAPSTEPQTVGTFIVPTKFDADMAYVELQFDNDYLLSWTFPDTSWESGYEYTYELIITENGLRLGDVIVEEWHDNDEGTIIINK